MKLMIVESPTKVKTINKYLGDDWIVKASIGHIRDLPDNDMGINFDNYKPKYVTSKGKSKVIRDLKEAIKKVDSVYLASDTDREGEAIAWHLKEVLNLKSYQRVEFNEITKKSILKAIENPRQINNNMVKAQEGRRVLDRLVGYTISPALSKKAGIPLSAGRVQSPALKLVVDREIEIRNHVAKEYYSAEITLKTDIKALLIDEDWHDKNEHIYDIELLNKIRNIKKVKVVSAKKTEKTTKPKAPFITSTLQQAASTTLKYSPADTMKYAQALFEKGFITYHRTDNPNISDDGFADIKYLLEKNNNKAEEPRTTWKTKDSAQAAHEAIRPSDPAIKKAGDNVNEEALYLLIRERAIASAMKPAIDEVTEIIFSTNEVFAYKNKNQQARFLAKGVVERAKGWRSVIVVERDSTKKDQLPDIFKETDIHDVSCNVLTKKTMSAKRFTEASLIKILEKLGIGRPSTYASILENIKKRKYIEISKKDKEKVIFATKTGESLVFALKNLSFMNYSYTSDMEKQLDKIAVGEGSYYDLIDQANTGLTSEKNSITIDSQITAISCPKCGNPVKQLKSKKTKGKFWVHITANSDCEKYISDKNNKPVILEKLEKPAETCQKCGKTIARKYSKEKEFYFWVHTKDSKDCQKFIKDINGVAAFV